MDEKRKGEIALALLESRLKRELVTLSDKLLGEITKDTGIPLDELRIFVGSLFEKVIAEILKPSQGTGT